MEILHGDCRDVMKTMESDSVDSIVTDPPYGLSFMGKGWDHGVPGVEFWVEALRVAKPGAFLLAFGGTRTFHRLAVAIEDAGWEVRDTVMWVYGSGFPKSHNVSKALDKEAGIEHPKNTLISKNGSMAGGNYTRHKMDVQSDLAKQWNGWGTALKPAWEPIIVARKPLDGTVVENVLRYGTGAMNIDGCRVGTDVRFNPQAGYIRRGRTDEEVFSSVDKNKPEGTLQVYGRWPANLIHDGSDEVVEAFPNQSSRFFYCAKASKKDRDEGLDGFDEKQYSYDGRNTPTENAYQRNDSAARNHHPTVKPTSLMAYLCNLVTRPGGVILDPFMGSGSTGKAAIRNGFDFIGIEQDAEYVKIAEARINAILPLVFVRPSDVMDLEEDERDDCGDMEA